MDEYKKAKTIFCFIGGELEVDTMPLIEKALCSGKKVAVPLCVSKGVMEARLITELSRLSKGRYKIMEPSLDSPVVSPKEIDFGVIPCVSCNEKGERLGHGGGYYDRFMQDTDFFKALICFSCLMTDKIPVEEHDIAVDAVIHEEKIIIL
ncbi:MAG: 5-formyltetrahydrofolate cyclo-ligase, partial [Oscillospiraceae bacterium]